MSTDAAHKRHWETSEVIFGIPLLVAVAFQFAIPLSMPDGLLRLASVIGGVVLAMIGVAFIFLARREFAIYSQPTDPGRPTTRLVTTGVFAFSRNPIYFGAACFIAGLGLSVNWLWVLVFLLPSLVACYSVLIAPEEKYLIARFGEEYLLYTAAVHRWIGRVRVQ
jgi:protein-S-isoprenylcysteine O-methyltransferase Ste14